MLYVVKRNIDPKVKPHLRVAYKRRHSGRAVGKRLSDNDKLLEQPHSRNLLNYEALRLKNCPEDSGMRQKTMQQE